MYELVVVKGEITLNLITLKQMCKKNYLDLKKYLNHTNGTAQQTCATLFVCCSGLTLVERSREI